MPNFMEKAGGVWVKLINFTLWGWAHSLGMEHWQTLLYLS